jgi:hypothetical protein
MFLAAMREGSKSKKEEWEHKPHAHATTDGMDAWFMMQRHRGKELRQRRQEAEQLLRGYRGTYITDGVNPAFSPRRSNHGRASFGHTLSDALDDPMTERRRHTTMPRTQRHFGEDDSEQRTGDHSFSGRLGPERSALWNGKDQDDGSQHDASGRHIFREAGRRHSDNEAREPGVTMDTSRYINISSSQGRLSEVSGRSGRSGRRSNFSTDSADREQPQAPETVWRDFISPGKFRSQVSPIEINVRSFYILTVFFTSQNSALNFPRRLVGIICLPRTRVRVLIER